MGLTKKRENERVQRVYGGDFGLAMMAITLVFTGLAVRPAHAQQPTLTPLQLVQAMVANEDDEEAHRDQYEFLSQERSDRTGGHLWTERVVETKQGRLRLLLAEDGTPLSPERAQQERAKLDAIVANPQTFLRQEQTQKKDEASAREMLDMLPRAFLFDNVRLNDGVWKMDFHPNPAYTPNSIQERVLYGMSGWVAIDAKAQRLLHIEAQLPHDVSIGFGLLATIRAGSRFASDRRDVDGHWRTVHVLSDIRGKAALFKSVSRNSEVSRADFVYQDNGITLAQAVALLETGVRD
jgi:hypothetical protein